MNNRKITERQIALILRVLNTCLNNAKRGFLTTLFGVLTIIGGAYAIMASHVSVEGGIAIITTGVGLIAAPDPKGKGPVAIWALLLLAGDTRAAPLNTPNYLNTAYTQASSAAPEVAAPSNGGGPSQVLLGLVLVGVVCLVVFGFYALITKGRFGIPSLLK